VAFLTVAGCKSTLVRSPLPVHKGWNCDPCRASSSPRAVHLQRFWRLFWIYARGISWTTKFHQCPANVKGARPRIKIFWVLLLGLICKEILTGMVEDRGAGVAKNFEPWGNFSILHIFIHWRLSLSHFKMKNKNIPTPARQWDRDWKHESRCRPR
jgi:hypothetical protein